MTEPETAPPVARRASRRYIAVDLGASSGRVLVGSLADGRVVLDEVHRFPNTPLRLPDGLHWDIVGLYREILTGLRTAGARYGPTFEGIGVDSWAVDYALLDARGTLLGLPYHYRDTRTDGVAAATAARVAPAELYARTGIAQLPFNTIYQLRAQSAAGDPALAAARSLLMIPDLLHYWLCGERATEYTNATTTGALGIDGAWARDVLDRLDIPWALLHEPVPPGTTLGTLRPDVARECGLGPVPVVLPATHDTASAVLAVPASSPRHAYLSSGTWSLLGVTLDRPLATEAAHLAGFTNEGGVAGSTRFLKNIMGLWIVQECRRVWARGGRDIDDETLFARAAAAASPGLTIDVDDPAFLSPADMPAALARQLRESGQTVPTDPAVLVRAVLEGLAGAYARTLLQIERTAGVRIETVHVVGGGARNGLLCQLTADRTGRPVVAGPVEATGLGNVLMQAQGRGAVGSLQEAREVVRRSVETHYYEPAR